MLHRLLLALLMLCLALPAAAMPVAQVREAQPMAMAMMHHGHHAMAPASEPDTAGHHGKHECIGCIAPLARLPIVPAAPRVLAAPVLPALTDGLFASTLAPETPPPRT